MNRYFILYAYPYLTRAIIPLIDDKENGIKPASGDCNRTGSGGRREESEYEKKVSCARSFLNTYK